MPHKDRWALALLVAVFCLLGALHGVVIPLFEAPDEIWHFGFIEVMARKGNLPVQSTGEKNMWLRESGQPPLYHILSAFLCAPFDTSDFSGFVRFNLAHPAIDANSTSEAANVFIHTPYEAFPYRGSVLVVHLLRLVGVLWGAGTVVGVYLTAREVAPESSAVAIVAAGCTALNPHFIFISSVINNDAAAACLCTLVLWRCVRLAGGRIGRAYAMYLGGLLGLALLSKISALALLPLVALALALAWWRDRDWRALLFRGAMVFGTAFLASGWWYIRNWVLYGDPLGWGIWLQDLGMQHLSFAELLRQFGHVFTSFWAPADGLFPQPVFWGLGALLAVSVPGLVLLAAHRRRREGLCAEGVILAGAWFVLLFASLIRYMNTTPSAEGRLLFPGIASFCLFLTLGWHTLLPGRWQSGAFGLVLAGLLAIAVSNPLFAIRTRYALPLVDERRLSLDMAPRPMPAANTSLLGVEIEPQVFSTGDVVRIHVYWRAEETPPPELRAVVRLWSVGGRLLGQSNHVPAGEVYPPDLWRAGDVVRDEHRVVVVAPGPAACRVMVSLYGQHGTLGKFTTPPTGKLSPDPVPAEMAFVPLDYRLGGVVTLLGVELPQPASGSEIPISLLWRADKEIAESYTVFVHLLDADGQRVGQGDGMPVRGDYATPWWSPGDVVVDTHLVLLDGPFSADGYFLVGMFRQEDGTRMPAYRANGDRVPDDAIRLDVGQRVGHTGDRHELLLRHRSGSGVWPILKPWQEHLSPATQ
jgi:4-amino-4-deoxy-L-arabinose transferase-like glycosyltransferase